MKAMPKINLSKLNLSKGKQRKVTDTSSHILRYVVLIAICFVFLFPILEMISYSFMTVEDVIAPDVIWIPNEFTLGNYKIAIIVMDYFKALFNSFWVSGLLAIIQTTVSAITGYAFARYNFKAKRFLFASLIIAFIIPIQLLTASHQIIFTTLQSWTGISFYGTLLPQIMLVIFGQGINSAILIIIFQSFFEKIPKDLYEAAEIDGANTLQVFWNITVRISLPIIFVVFLFAFVWNWNEDFVTNVFLSGEINLLTGKLDAFDTLFGSAGGGGKLSEAYRSAATMLSILPLIIIYIFTQRQFVEGIESVGITGQ